MKHTYDQLAAHLAEAVTAWPEFDTDEPVNGPDLVEWFGQYREQAKILRGKIAKEAKPMQQTALALD